MNKITFTAWLQAILLLLAGESVFAQSSSRFSYQKYVEAGNDTLPYRMLVPDYNKLRKYPLVIFLHGSGERGSDNEAQLKWGVQNFATDQNMMLHPAIVVAPQCPLTMSWSNFSKNDNKLSPVPSRAMELVIGLIHQLIKTMPVDTNRIYITGLSMGGYGAFDAVERYPQLFAAAVPVCGGGDSSRAAGCASVPMWIFHGAEDPAVSPDNSLQMLIALTKAGAHPGFTQYPETGHFSWIQAYADAMMMEWLFRQHK